MSPASFKSVAGMTCINSAGARKMQNFPVQGSPTAATKCLLEGASQ
jgi:hypothetical protein